MVEQLENKEVNRALVSTAPPPGEDEFIFERAEPVLWSFLSEQYEPIDIEHLKNNNLLLLQRTAEH